MKKAKVEELSAQDYIEKIKGMLGFAKRAGKLTFGYDAAVKDIKCNKVKAVFISNDASERTVLGIKKVCEDKKLDSSVLPFDKEILGRSIGRDGVAVVAVTDKSFADRIIELSSSLDMKD